MTIGGGCGPLSFDARRARDLDCTTFTGSAGPFRALSIAPTNDDNAPKEREETQSWSALISIAPAVYPASSSPFFMRSTTSMYSFTMS
jgi:hypothetical protein